MSRRAEYRVEIIPCGTKEQAKAAMDVVNQLHARVYLRLAEEELSCSRTDEPDKDNVESLRRL